MTAASIRKNRRCDLRSGSASGGCRLRRRWLILRVALAGHHEERAERRQQEEPLAQRDAGRHAAGDRAQQEPLATMARSTTGRCFQGVEEICSTT